MYYPLLQYQTIYKLSGYLYRLQILFHYMLFLYVNYIFPSFLIYL